MIIYISGPRLRPGKYHQLQEALYTALGKREVHTRGFSRQDIRIFFPVLAYPPAAIEVAVFAGSGTATSFREVTVWKESIEPVVAKAFPKQVINGFVSKLDVTAQFTSVFPLIEPKKKKT